MTLLPGGPYASGLITLVRVSWHFVLLSSLICTDNSFFLVLSVVCYLFVILLWFVSNKHFWSWSWSTVQVRLDIESNSQCYKSWVCRCWLMQNCGIYVGGILHVLLFNLHVVMTDSIMTMLARSVMPNGISRPQWVNLKGLLTVQLILLSIL